MGGFSMSSVATDAVSSDDFFALPKGATAPPARSVTSARGAVRLTYADGSYVDVDEVDPR